MRCLVTSETLLTLLTATVLCPALPQMLLQTKKKVSEHTRPRTGQTTTRRSLSAVALLRKQEAAGALVAAPPPDADAERRVDLTQQWVVAIDDSSTTEVDDGLAVEWLPDGRPRLWVHVADPTRWVRPGEPLDLEARRRGSTMYLPNSAPPLL